MGACYEEYYHEFVSAWTQPTSEGAIFLRKAIKSLDTCDVDPWVEVFPVHRGEVYWYGWNTQPDAEKDARRHKRDYGVEEIPKLGGADLSGYLIRHVSQGKVACYGPGEIPKDQPFPEVREARVKSLTNYLHLMEWLAVRG